MATTELVNILIRAKDDATKALKTVEKTLGGIDKQVKAVAATYLTYEAVTSSITAVTKAALEEEKQWNKVTAALRLKGKAVDYVLPQIQDMTDALERETGISDELISGSMYRLIMANYDVAESYKIVRLAADISSTTNASLEETTVSLIKGMNGSEMQLNRLAASLGINIDRAGTAAEKIKLINDQVSGAAQAQLRGYQRITTDLSISWERWKEAVGTGFLSNAAPAMQFIDWWLRVSAEAAKPENDLWAGVNKSAGRVTETLNDLSKAASAVNDSIGDASDLSGKFSAIDDQKIHDFIEFAAAMGRVKATLPKAFLGEDDRAIKDIEIYKGELREVKDELISINGLARLTTDVSKGDELQGPTWREAQEALADYQATLNETARKQQEAFNKISGAAKQVLSPLREWIAEGKSIGDAFANMGQRVKQILADMVINMLAEAIAKALGLKAALSAIGVGTGGGLFGFLGGLLPFDDRHNDSMLTREVRWMGELITRGITQGMATGMPNGHWMQQPQMAAAPTTIVLQFNGPVTSEQFVKDTILPVIEQASKHNHSRIQLRPVHLTGSRDGF